jgi:predicted CXXCH cytochrome family protein
MSLSTPERFSKGLCVGALFFATIASASEEPVGESCAACHGVIVDEYRATGMARAIEPLRHGEFEGLESVKDHDTGFSYELGESPGGFQITERWGVGDAEVSRVWPLLYAIGAGRLDRSYVASMGGMEWFAPLEVLSASGELKRHAALAPGHEISPGLRFTTGITNECLACHTDSPPAIDYPSNLHSPSWEPHGISCAACHAAGEEHALHRESKAAGDDPALALDELDLAGRISLCARCHLQGDARISLTGSRSLSAPGVDLLAEWAVYLPQRQDEDVAFVSQVERMLSSVCFTASLEAGAQPLECTTCHDPHRSLDDEAARALVRASCMSCHEAADEDCSRPKDVVTGRDCVDCHMPLVEVFDVGGVRIHDHEIAREPASTTSYSKIRVKHSRGGEVRRFSWPWKEAPPEDPGLEMMAALIAGGPERAQALVGETAGPQSRRLATYHHLRGVLLEARGELDEARRSYMRALILDPESGESSVNLSIVLGRMSRAPEGIAVLDELLERHPRAEGAWRNRSLLKNSLGDLRGFASDLEVAQTILPRAENARALAAISRRLGDESGAKLWEQRARLLSP